MLEFFYGLSEVRKIIRDAAERRNKFIPATTSIMKNKFGIQRYQDAERDILGFESRIREYSSMIPYKYTHTIENYKGFRIEEIPDIIHPQYLYH